MPNLRPFIRVNFPRIGTTFSPIEGSIIQEEYKHDIVSVIFRLAPYDFSKVKSGEPAMVKYGYFPNDYVQLPVYFTNSDPEYIRTTTHSSIDAYKPFRKLHTLFLGSTWLMKQRALDTWKEITPSDLVQTIARKFRFSSNVSTINTVDDFFQNGNSYWKFLVNIAQEYGVALVSRGTELHFIKRSDAIRSHKYIQMFDPGDIVRFIPEYGANTPDGGDLATRTAMSVDSASGQLIQTTTPPNFTKLKLGSVVDAPIFNNILGLPIEDQDELIIRLNSDLERNRYYITAHLEIVGESRVRPGTVIRLNQMANPRDNGYWYVHKAHHQFKVNEGNIITYYTTMKLGRDSYGKFNDTFPPVKYVTSQDGTTVKGTTPSVLVSDHWTSPWYWNVVL